MTKLLYIATFLLICDVLHYGETVRCWTCSSDVTKECGEPFVTTNVPLTDCDKTVGTFTYLHEYKSACKTLKKIVNGETVITRGCTRKVANDDSISCPKTSTAAQSNAVTAFCETCDYDACNMGSSQTNTGTWSKFKKMIGIRN